MSISAIITTFNRPDSAIDAIKSVLAQTYPPSELIIIDDGSEAIAKEQITRYISKISAFDINIKYVYNDINAGLATSRNLGANLAQGDYLAYLDDDDVWHPTKLEKQILLYNDNPNLALVYCWASIYASGLKKGSRKPNQSGKIEVRKMLLQQPITNGSTWLIKTSILKEIKFSSDLKKGIDGDFIRRIALTHHVAFVPEELIDYAASTKTGEQGRITQSYLGYHKDILKRFTIFRSELKKDRTSRLALHYTIHRQQLKSGRKLNLSWLSKFTVCQHCNCIVTYPKTLNYWRQVANELFSIYQR